MTGRGVRRALLWFLPLAVGLATAALLATGFAAGMSGRLGIPIAEAPAPTPTPAVLSKSGVFRIVALGDSLTRGAGDAAGGYPERVASALRKTGRTVTVENLGVDGLTTDDLVKKVSDPGVTGRLAGADLILISISGNDLTHALPSSPAGAAEGDPTRAALTRAAANVASILAAVRKANPAAPVRLLGLYDPFLAQMGDRRLARQVLLRWNTAIEEAGLGVEGAIVVPLADLFEARPDRLSPDRFHPGPQGYDEIAQRVVSTLRLTPQAAG